MKKHAISMTSDMMNSSREGLVAVITISSTIDLIISKVELSFSMIMTSQSMSSMLSSMIWMSSSWFSFIETSSAVGSITLIVHGLSNFSVWHELNNTLLELFKINIETNNKLAIKFWF